VGKILLRDKLKKARNHMWISTIPLLLISILILVQSPAALQTQEQCTAAPLKENLEEILGKPDGAPVGTEGFIRFMKHSHSVIVKFDSSERAENLIINGSEGIDDLRELLNQLVPKSSRGRFLERGPGKTFRRNWTIYVEEYECLTIEYSEQYAPLNSLPAAVNIKWKAASDIGAGQVPAAESQ
jgi:hypothetical protein